MTDKFEYTSTRMLFHGHVDHLMGTCLDLVTVGETRDKMEEIWKSICAEAGRLDRMLNRFDTESEVSRINSSGGIRNSGMSSELRTLRLLAEEYKERTCGLFDIYDGDGKMDFGGFAKGYLMMKCREMMIENSVSCAFADFGRSSIFGIGRHPWGDCWKVSIINPYSGAEICEMDVSGMSLSTSGNSPSYSGHIRNPHTGKICEDRRMVTVLSVNPLDSEVLSTAFMVADRSMTEEIARNFPDISYEIHLL